MKKNISKSFADQHSFFKAVPAIVWQVLFFYLPIFFVLALSLASKVRFGITLEHFYQLFKPLYFKIIGRSLLLASTTAILSLLISYPIAYYIAIKKRSWTTLFLIFLIIPFWTNFLVLTYAWFFVLDAHGLLNTILLKLHIIQTPLSLLNTLGAVVSVMVYAYLPFMIMPILTVLEKFDYALIEASRDLGATMGQTFWRIIFPHSKSGVATGFMLVFVPAFGEFAIPMLVGGNKYMFVGTLISHYFFNAQDKYAGAAFTVISSFVLAVSVIMVYLLVYRPSFLRGKKYGALG